MLIYEQVEACGGRHVVVTTNEHTVSGSPGDPTFVVTHPQGSGRAASQFDIPFDDYMALVERGAVIDLRPLQRKRARS